MRKGLLIQFVLVFAALVCAFVLNIMLLSLAVEDGNMNYVHVVWSTAFFLSALILQRVLYELIQQHHAEQEDEDVHIIGYDKPFEKA